ncbi:hypothetical protein QBC44DRAFT_357356, partial [Cladorrhinum sp. PSN332]
MCSSTAASNQFAVFVASRPRCAAYLPASTRQPSNKKMLHRLRWAEMIKNAAEIKALSYQPYVEIDQVDEFREDPTGDPVLLGTWNRLWMSLVHVFPLSLSIFLVFINLNRWFWFEEELPRGLRSWFLLVGGLDGFKNVLQLAAKIHELLVVASLAAITIKVCKRRLIESHIPLGHLTGAYRVGDVPYMFSPALWKGLLTIAPALGLLIFFNTLVATLVGPASAILMVPELDWFPLPGAFDGIQGPILFSTGPNETWPLQISGSGPASKNCDTELGIYAVWCPSGGFPELWNWAEQWPNSGLENGLVFQDSTGASRRNLVIGSSSYGTTTRSTTISLASVMTVGRLLNYIKIHSLGSISNTTSFKLITTSKSSVIFQPVVQTKCQLLDRDAFIQANTSVSEWNDNRDLQCLGDEQCERFRQANVFPDGGVFPQAWNISDNLFKYSFHPADDRQAASLLFNATIPYLELRTRQVKVWVAACSILAHWIPSTLNISPSQGGFLESNITDLDGFFDRALEGKAAVGPMVRIDPDWIPYLNPTVGKSPSSNRSFSVFDEIFGTMFSPNKETEGNPVFNPGTEVLAYSKLITRDYFERILCAVVTESLARVQYDENYAVLVNNDTTIQLDNLGVQYRVFEKSRLTIQSPSVEVIFNLTLQEFKERLDQWTKFDFEAQRYGHGSGKPGSTKVFALFVMYTYFFIVFVYFAHVMIVPRLRGFGDVPTVLPWNDLQDLILLAWNSKPIPRLSGQSSVKIDAGRAWKASVAIRADESGRAQLASGSETDMAKLRKNARYS